MNETLVGNVVSKTNWLAAATALVGYAQMPDTQRIIAKLLAPVMEPETVEFTLASLTILCGMTAIVLRNVTTEPVVVKGQRLMNQ